MLTTSLLIGIAIVLLAGFIQGLTSFGFALVSLPLLMRLVPVTQGVPLVVLLSLITNILVLAQSYRRIEMGKTWILLAASLLAAPLGAWALVCIDARIIRLLAAAVIVIASLAMLSGKNFVRRSDWLILIPVGFTSGFLNGSVSMSGPPVALFLSSQNIDKQTFRANLTLYAIILNLFTLASFTARGLLTYELMGFSCWLIPSLLLGVWLGIMAAQFISQSLFRKLVLCLLLASGLATLWGAL